MWTLAVLVATFLAAVYGFVWKKYGYWKEKGVPNPEPTFFVGNMGQSIAMKKHFGEIISDVYKNYPEHKYVGFYKLLNPTVLIRDPELIKDVLVTSFSHFEANDLYVDEEIDPILGKNPFVLEGFKWKLVRGQLTRNFTPNKLKLMYSLMEEVGEKMVKYLDKLGNNAVCMDAKELGLKFTTENVASCAFGLDGQSFEDENSEFVKRSREIGKLDFITNVKTLILFFVPSLSKVLKVKFFNDYISNYLISIVSQTLEYRIKNNVVRNDFLDVMIQMKKTCTEYEFTDVDITAQAAGFFGDGVETSSTVLSYIIHYVAKYPEVQKKLQEEYDRLKAKHGSITYEAMLESSYMDCVIDETLRIEAPAMSLFKRCTKDYELPAPTEGGSGKVLIEKGTSVLIPVDGLHMDPKYFPEPEKFIPERFSAENKEQFTKFTYLPFGEGPRVCLGRKFAVLQIKTMLSALFGHFNVSVNGKTAKKLLINPSGFIRVPLGGIWLDIKRRKI